MSKKKIAVSPVVARRLRRVKEAILQNPDFYRQNTFGYIPTKKDNLCGTVCCIGGWLHYFAVGPEEHEKTVRNDNVNEINTIALKQLDRHSGENLNLFGLGYLWEDGFGVEYRLIGQESKNEREKKRRMAELAGRRIDHFIETGR